MVGFGPHNTYVRAAKFTGILYLLERAKTKMMWVLLKNTNLPSGRLSRKHKFFIVESALLPRRINFMTGAIKHSNHLLNRHIFAPLWDECGYSPQRPLTTRVSIPCVWALQVWYAATSPQGLAWDYRWLTFDPIFKVTGAVDLFLCVCSMLNLT